MIKRVAPHIADITAIQRSIIGHDRVRLIRFENHITVQLFGPRNANPGAITIYLDELKTAINELEINSETKEVST